jgi:hypothetical protein
VSNEPSGTSDRRASGKDLPAFDSPEEAERALFAGRDLLLGLLRRTTQPQDPFRFDMTPESLKTLEQWYFDLADRNAFAQRGTIKAQFEEAMSMYFGLVLVQNCPEFTWKVEAFPFSPGRYEVGVGKPLLFIAARTAIDLDARPNNRRRQSLWTEYAKYSAAG